MADVHWFLAQLAQTAIHVTHDHTEAFAVADRVALIRDDRIHRTAAPRQLRADPRDAWTAGFLGLGTVWQPSEGSVPRTGGRDISTPWGL